MINHLENNKETILEVKNITKTYSKNGEEFKALDDVSFSVKKGEFFGMVEDSAHILLDQPDPQESERIAL